MDSVVSTRRLAHSLNAPDLVIADATYNSLSPKTPRGMTERRTRHATSGVLSSWLWAHTLISPRGCCSCYPAE
jgi:hypothetical protein